MHNYTTDDEIDEGGDEHLTSQTLNADGTPKRPMNAFMIFARRRRPQVSAENQAMRTGDISKILSQEWKAMVSSDKQFYLAQAKQLKESFNTKYPDYVYRRRPNNTRKRRKGPAPASPPASPTSASPNFTASTDVSDPESSPDGGAPRSLEQRYDPAHPWGGPTSAFNDDGSQFAYFGGGGYAPYDMGYPADCVPRYAPRVRTAGYPYPPQQQPQHDSPGLSPAASSGSSASSSRSGGGAYRRPSYSPRLAGAPIPNRHSIPEHTHRSTAHHPSHSHCAGLALSSSLPATSSNSNTSNGYAYDEGTAWGNGLLLRKSHSYEMGGGSSMNYANIPPHQQNSQNSIFAPARYPHSQSPEATRYPHAHSPELERRASASADARYSSSSSDRYADEQYATSNSTHSSGTSPRYASHSRSPPLFPESPAPNSQSSNPDYTSTSPISTNYNTAATSPPLPMPAYPESPAPNSNSSCSNYATTSSTSPTAATYASPLPSSYTTAAHSPVTSYAAPLPSYGTVYGGY